MTAAAHFTQELKSENELVMTFEEAGHIFTGATGELTCLWRTDNAGAIHAYFENMKDNISPSNK